LTRLCLGFDTRFAFGPEVEGMIDDFDAVLPPADQDADVEDGSRA